jgi:dCTP deaminase
MMFTSNNNQEAVGSVLVDSDIQGLNLTPYPDDVQPCSLDIRTGSRLWQIPAVPSVAGGFQLVNYIAAHTPYNSFDISHQEITLTPGSIYLAELNINLQNLPPQIWGIANPKSSSGRIDLHCVLLTEGASQFNLIPENPRGKAFLVIIPQSFPVKMTSGIALIQVRLFRGQRSFLTKRELLTLHHSYGVVRDSHLVPEFTENGVLLHLDLSGNPSNLVSVGTGNPLSLVKSDKLADPTKYFREKELHSGSLYLEPGEFLLARAVEKVAMPPLTCAEMLPYSEAQGEIRSHYAGFFDRGFGYGRTGEIPGSSVVCEIRNISPVAVVLSHNQPIATLRYEYLEKEPSKIYGEVASNYQGQQGIRLAKYFAKWPGEPEPPSPAQTTIHING